MTASSPAAAAIARRPHPATPRAAFGSTALRAAAVAAAMLLCPAPTRAESAPASPAPPPDPPYLDQRLAVTGYVALQGEQYDYMVDSTADLALRLAPDWLVLYRHRDHTPFYSPGPVPGNQPDNLTLRDELRVYRAVTQRLALGVALRHEEALASDRAGAAAARSIAPVLRWRGASRRLVTRLEAEAGPLDTGDRGPDADAYWQLHLALDYPTTWAPLFWNVRRPWITLGADAYGLTGGDGSGESLMLGPELVLPTDAGNEVRLLAKYWHNDGVPFDAGLDTDDALIGLALASPRMSDEHRSSPEFRDFQVGTSIQGRYDVGMESDAWLSQLTLLSQLLQLDVFDLPLAVTLDYTHRRVLAWDDGQIENTSYLVAFGLETPLPARWQGAPLVAGVDYTHRSDHALDPEPELLVPGARGYIASEDRLDNGNINVFPRFRLQSDGWDDPMLPRDLVGRRGWLGRLGWRLTAGSNAGGSRDRGQFAGQAAGQCDLIGFGTWALYAAGAAGIGEETPDWMAELGARTRQARIFGRIEDWAVTTHLGGGELALIGVAWGL